jgi:cytochrome P450
MQYEYVAVSTLLCFIIPSMIHWFFEYRKLPKAYPDIFSWRDPKFLGSYFLAALVQIPIVRVRNTKDVAKLAKGIDRKTGALREMFELNTYKLDILVNQATNATEQALRASATKFMAQRVRNRFSTALNVFQDMVRQTAQSEFMPLRLILTEALFEHSNKVIFDYEPNFHDGTDMMEWIDFINYHNTKGFGMLQFFFPWTYRLPLKRNQRRRQIIDKFAPLFDDLLQQQKQLDEDGEECLFSLAKDKLPDHGDSAKGFFFGLVTASLLTSITTSCCLLHYLAIHPDVQDEIFNEINKILPSDLQELNHDILMKLVHTRAFVKECLRLISPVPNLPRSIGKVHILLDLQGLNKSDTLWHEAEKINTNRFIVGGEDSPKLVSHGDKFFPFGVGRRSCPAAEYAQFEFVLMVALYVREFEISYDQNPEHALQLEYVGGVPHITNSDDLVLEFATRKQKYDGKRRSVRRESALSMFNPMAEATHESSSFLPRRSLGNVGARQMAPTSANRRQSAPVQRRARHSFSHG